MSLQNEKKINITKAVMRKSGVYTIEIDEDTLELQVKKTENNGTVTEANISIFTELNNVQEDDIIIANADGTFTNMTLTSFKALINPSASYIEQIATNYSSLNAGTTTGALAYVENSQGTAWLPYTVGGTYYPKGWYQWDGAQWNSSRAEIAEALDAASGTGSILQGDNISLLTNDVGYTTFDGDYNSLTNTPAPFESTGGTVTAEVTMQSDLSVDDNNKINIGSGDDLQVYHNGTDTHIDNTNGDLYISTQDGGDVVIQGSGTQTPMATFTEGGGVVINHNGSAAIETTTTGVDVTGNLTTTGTVNGYDLSVQDAAIQKNTDEIAGEGLSTYYKELSYVSGTLDKIEYWDSSAKNTKYYTKQLGYTSGTLTSTTLTRHSDNNSVTKTMSYDANGNLTSITKS